MKVTIKVKHLAIGVLAIGLALTLLQFVVIPKLQVRAAIKHFEAGNVEGKREMLALIDNAASPGKRWELIRQYMIGPGGLSIANRYDVYVGPSSTMGGGSGSSVRDYREWGWEEKLPYLLEYVSDAPVGMDWFEAAKQIAEYYLSEGRTNEALSMLELAEGRRGDAWGARLKLERAKIYAARGDTEAAGRLVDEMEAAKPSESLDLDGDIVQFKARLLVAEGKARDALQEIDREIETTREWMEAEKKKFPDMQEFTPAKLERLKTFRQLLRQAVDDGADKDAAVSGTVKRSDGTPLARVGVFLRSEQDVNHSVIDGEPYQTLTDAQGRYEFKNVIPGNYQLYLGLQFDQIDGWTWPTMYGDWIVVEGGKAIHQDVALQRLIEIQSPSDEEVLADSKVKFSWQAVEGAVHYSLYGQLPIEHGVSSVLIRDRILGHSTELPVETLYEASGGGYSYQEVNGEMVLETRQLLGFADPNSRYSWYVEAYDERGRLITRSNGYRLNEDTMGPLPFFYLKERSLNAADELLLSGRLDEALAEYKKSFEADRSDRYSLNQIIRILGGQAAMARHSKTSDEAIPYLERMMELAPGKSDTLFNLFDYYEGKRDWAKVDTYYRQYLSAREGVLDGYAQSRYATALMKQKRLDEASAQFREALENDTSHRFVGNFLAVELYKSGSIELVAKLAETYPQRASYDYSDWSRLIRGLAQESRNYESETYGKTLKEALEAYFDGNESVMDGIRQPALKAFVEALRKVS
ncbi:carboxypeptidase regulatory-like domain-containing protein [Cohnella terricola]|uniref:Carboxypeptidase regulatory-like domain-containing protein n=1 Tax=Cohnella terricola TaxID=1289167 RepID=A0A559JMU5_9BACL|nr:carboxypeptidase regulatory-like domain-containing protein [Cohnella terricola]TVY01193.1 hypothetical protein FPZ45_08570 [Cohnella terricola]